MFEDLFHSWSNLLIFELIYISFTYGIQKRIQTLFDCFKQFMRFLVIIDYQHTENLDGKYILTCFGLAISYYLLKLLENLLQQFDQIFVGITGVIIIF